MKRKIIIAGGLLIMITFLACNKNDEGSERLPNSTSAQEELVFGHYYGMCAGEQCIETYKLTDSILYEDTVDGYAGSGPFDFFELDDEKFESVKDLLDSMPSELLAQEDRTFGCPDCADQGGLFIQYIKDKQVKTWRIDQAKSITPTYLHNFMDEVNEKIDMINQ